MRTILAIVLLLSILTGITIWALQPEPSKDSSPSREATETNEPAADHGSRQTSVELPASMAEAAAPSTDPADKKVARGVLITPDGKRMPALNGCTGELSMGWPREIPYSPIVDKRIGKGGEEYYLHADGSQSKTVMAYRSDLQRMEAQVVVMNPRPVAPYRKAQ